ncbi:MAG TPA: toll/interleukin-1 receptor domain-containing protein [Thermoanaerobaculia bacterium]|jgi:tetratricopeptide (TPR) repeat protein
MTDFFISYTQADRDWAEWIAWTLEAAGFTTTIQAWDFAAGSNFIIEMHKAAAEAERTIAVLSPEYLGSHFGQMEWTAALAQKKELLPIRVREVEVTGLLAGIVYTDLVGLAGEAAGNALLTAARKERPKPLTKPPFPAGPPPFPLEITDLPETKLPEIGPLPQGSRMPFAHNPLFVGREEELRALARQLRAGETSAVGEVRLAAASGLGGIGKTQLATEFVHRYGRYFEGGVFWMSFADPAAVPAEVAACGRSLDLHPSYDALPLDQQVRLVEDDWARPVPRLLVFDNCEEEALLDRYRPRTGGARVLVTSRRPQWDLSLGVQSVQISTLPRPASIELLRKFRPDVPNTDPALGGIADKLGDLPLALHLAGSFLKRYANASDGQPAAYLEALRQGGLLQHPSLQGKFAGISPTSHEAHVGRTFALSIEKLKPEDETDALALALLARTVHFAPGEPIPRELLLKTVNLESGARLQAEDALARLTALGLLEAGKAGALVMHRLVAEFARDSDGEEDARDAVEESLLAEAERLIDAGIPGPLLAWQPHLRAITEIARRRETTNAARLCNALGHYLWIIGDYLGARPYLERALAIREKILGAEHPDTTQSLNNLGVLLRSEGDLAAARPYYERALAIREKVLGAEHPDTATSLHNLGGLLQSQGDLAAARPYCERALTIREKVLGAEHPDTALSLNNLGSLLRRQGDLAAARPYYDRALAIFEARLGPDHPNTKMARENLEALGRLGAGGKGEVG